MPEAQHRRSNSNDSIQLFGLGCLDLSEVIDDLDCEVPASVASNDISEEDDYVYSDDDDDVPLRTDRLNDEDKENERYKGKKLSNNLTPITLPSDESTMKLKTDPMKVEQNKAAKKDHEDCVNLLLSSDFKSRHECQTMDQYKREGFELIMNDSRDEISVRTVWDM